MNFKESLFVCFRKYFVFNGRASRPEFWWFTLFVSCTAIFTSPLDFLIFGTEGRDWLPITDIVSLGLVVPSLSVGARRLHDIDRSGWWQLPIYMCFIGGFTMGYLGIFFPDNFDLSWYFYSSGATILIASTVWIVLFLGKKGSPVENQYGPPSVE